MNSNRTGTTIDSFDADTSAFGLGMTSGPGPVRPASGLGMTSCGRTVSPAFGLGMISGMRTRIRSMRPRIFQTLLPALLALPAMAFAADDYTGGNPDLRPTEAPYAYRTLSGDSLSAVATRFGVAEYEIQNTDGLSISNRGFLAPGLILSIPRKLHKLTSADQLFPDDEIVYSKSSTKFEIENFILGKRGFLLHYRDADGKSGAEIISKLSRDNSINPKILLSMLEFASGWVSSPNPSSGNPDYPMNFYDIYHKGLYSQMMMAIDYLERGYYGWREAKILCLYFGDGENIRLAPDLNAGTVAVMYYFSKLYGDSTSWSAALQKFFALHSALFGDPRRADPEPLFPSELYPPYLILPFALGQSWCFSNGPHGAWDAKGPAAALDFGPSPDETGGPLTRAVLASASGCVVRSDRNTVVVDLDCDGSENTGWNIFYFHLAEAGRAREGIRVGQGQRIGYASCEGGVCSGIHVHMARKYNGEWILAGGPIPFTLSGWRLAAYETDEAAPGWKYFRGGRAVIASNDCHLDNMISR
jgi:LasA protease